MLMNAVPLLIILTIALPFMAKAYGLQTEGIRCDKSTVESEICQFEIRIGDVQRPYKYEIRRAQPGSPTLIAVPGGPGQGLIGSMNNVKYGDFIPEDFGVILIDPRGTRKNDFGADSTGELYNTSKVASDVIQVINKEKLTNYFVHGQSYGTVVVTILGSLISQIQMPQPRGLILSGIVEKSFDNILTGYNDQLKRLLSKYSSVDQQNIVFSLKKIQNEFGENKRTFAILFINFLTPNVEDLSSDGVVNINMRKFFDALAEGNFNSSNQAMTFFHETAKNIGPGQKPIITTRNNSMEETIKCHELTKNDEMLDIYFDFDRFELVSNVSDCVQKGYSLDHPYDSKKYQIAKIPIFYIQGLLDPATTLQGAKAHYDKQMSSNKVFVQLDNYAHTALIGLWPCKVDLWQALMAGTFSFREHIYKCNRPEIRILE